MADNKTNIVPHQKQQVVTDSPPEPVRCEAGVFDRYRDRRQLGEGGMGVVERGLDPNLGREVAIKQLRTEFSQDPVQTARFVREAKITAQLEHPNIMPVHEFGISGDGIHYFSMKLVKDRTLRHILDQLIDGDPETRKLFTRDKLIDLFIPICQAVAYAHSRNVIHRDLKPANILIGDFGEVLVLDWGLAKSLASAEDGSPAERNLNEQVDSELSADLTHQGTVSGTPRYMSPEQFEQDSDEPPDGRSDLFALGCILYEMLSLKPAFSGDSTIHIIGKICKGQFESLREIDPKIPRELEAICIKAMDPDRTSRYQTVTELIEDLRNYQHQRPVSAYHYSWVQRFWKLCLRHPVISSSIAAAVLALFVGFSTLWVYREIRVQQLLNRADQETEAGAKLYRTLLNQQAGNARLLDRKSLDEAENHYTTAVILYQMAGSDGLNEDHCYRGFSQIFGDRLTYAVNNKNFDAAQKWLDFIRGWLGNTFEKAPPEYLPVLQNWQKEIDAGKRTSSKKTP